MLLVTWNIQWGRGADGRVDLARIARELRRVAGGDADVICLQEVSDGHDSLPGCDGSDQFAQLAALLPGFEPVTGVATDTRPRDGAPRKRFGNLLLSRWPVRQALRHLLPWPAEDGVRSMQRVAVEATLDTPLGLLRVTTTHLEYYSAPQRAAQVERLRELQREAAAHARTLRPGSAAEGAFEPVPRAAPAVLAGDFNCRPGDPALARLLEPIDAATPAYRDAWAIAHPGRPHEATVGRYDKAQWPGEPFTFDFILVTEDLAGRVCDVRVDAASDASDHQPMLLELG
jgi:endonuclease/exonuclease/phosphatase family metal-dependent hydrolase